MFPVEIGDLIENVAAVVVENRDALRGFDDGYQTHREGYGAARISVECELVPAGEESVDKAIKVVLIFGELFVRGKVGEPYKLALFADAMRGRQGEGRDQSGPEDKGCCTKTAMPMIALLAFVFL